MLNRVLLIVIALGATACATDDAATPMVDNTASTTRAIAPVTTSTSGQTAETPVDQAPRVSGHLPTANAPTGDATPASQSTPSSDAPQNVGFLSMENIVAYERDDIVCRKVRQTGSNLFRKVCESRAAIEERAERDKDVLRQMVLIR